MFQINFSASLPLYYRSFPAETSSFSLPLSKTRLKMCSEPNAFEWEHYISCTCIVIKFVICEIWRLNRALIGSLSSDVFERRTSTGNGRFALLSRDFEQIFGQIVSVRIKTLGNINTVASRLIKRGKGSLPLDVRRSKTSLLKLPYYHLIKSRKVQWKFPSMSKA